MGFKIIASGDDSCWCAHCVRYDVECDKCGTSMHAVKRDVVATAREHGWVITDDQQVACPSCNGPSWARDLQYRINSEMSDWDSKHYGPRALSAIYYVASYESSSQKSQYELRDRLLTVAAIATIEYRARIRETEWMPEPYGTTLSRDTWWVSLAENIRSPWVLARYVATVVAQMEDEG